VKVRASLLLFALGAMMAQAQIFYPPLQHVADNIPEFNFSEIKKRKIKSIVFDMVDKKDFQVAEDKDLSRHYEFDSLGRLTRAYYTIIRRIIQKEFHTAPVYKRKRMVHPGHSYTKNIYEFDTLSCTFKYDEKGNLACKRYNDGSVYTSQYYWHDSLGRVTRILFCKETNSSPDKSVFVLGLQQKQFEERYKYAFTSETQYKKLCLNDEDRVFKEVIVSFGADSKPRQFNETFVATWINQVTDFSYNASGQLTEKKFTSNAGTPVETRDNFEYDAAGRLDMEKHYKNGLLISETGYVYDQLSGLPTSYVTRDPVNKSMQIVRLLYTYYP
jgi:hypothetical protein